MRALARAAVVFAVAAVSSAEAKVKAESAKVNMEGTPVATVLTVTGVKSSAQVREAEKQQDDTGGGLGGMLARKMMKKQGDPRSMLMTSSTELLRVTPDAVAPDVALPAGFELK